MRLNPNQYSTERRTTMNDKPVEPMRAENVEQFDVRIFEAQDLVISVIPHRDPSSVATEKYEIAASNLEIPQPILSKSYSSRSTSNGRRPRMR